jgi:hypothetical protein
LNVANGNTHQSLHVIVGMFTTATLRVVHPKPEVDLAVVLNTRSSMASSGLKEAQTVPLTEVTDT